VSRLTVGSTTARAVVLAALAAVAAAAPAQQVSRLPSTHGGTVVDASPPFETPRTDGMPPVAIAALPNDGTAAAIIGAAALADDAPRRLHFEAQSRDDARVRAQAAQVSRTGGRLVLQSGHGATFTFADGQRPGTHDAEGDGVTFSYLGPLAGTPFHRVEMFDEHDAPSSFLVSTEAPVAILLRTGADAVVLSPQGDRIVQVTDGLNGRFAIHIGSLAGGSYRLELACRGTFDSAATQVDGQLKGWHAAPDVGVDLAIAVSAAGQASGPIALRLVRRGDDWQVQASDPARLARQVGLACHRPRA
jgi:hypothetical protein